MSTVPPIPAITRPRITLIAAVASNGCIGRDNALLWHLPADMAHFRARTQGRPVLMGRKTWESLPPRFRPLPGRRNLVLSRSAEQRAFLAQHGAEPVSSVDEALRACAGQAELMVIGGAEVYALALPQADELVLTEVGQAFDGDAFFPVWARDAFDEVSREPHLSDAGWPFAIVVYRRRSVPATDAGNVTP